MMTLRSCVLALAACAVPCLAADAAQPTLLQARPPAPGERPLVLAGDERGLYLMQFRAAPVARQMAQDLRTASGGPRPDLESAEAKRLVQQISTVHAAVLEDINAVSGRPLRALHAFHFAYNGLVVALDRAQRAAAAAHPEVSGIEAVRALPLHSDVGPTHVGAPLVWDGSATAGLPGTSGEGRIVGVIDTGINWNSPSFADGLHYDHTNPLGAYLGVCAEREGPVCNDKLIGAYAVSHRWVEHINAECALTDPSAGELGLTQEICEALGVPLIDSATATDDHGHGSHTASTAVGNPVQIDHLGNTLMVSGVAPRANLVVYDACHTNVHGHGTCLNVATVEAVEQAMQDGVDVLNYSISGGTDPWRDATSLALLSATDMGIFVAAAAGNSGPDVGTVAHLEPWTATIAASGHGREFTHHIEVSGPTPLPDALLHPQPALLGTAGGPHAQNIPTNTPIIKSPTFGSGEDACMAFDDAALFADAIALVERGGCEFSQKVWYAQSAGAIAVLIANNAPGALRIGGFGEATIPVFGITQDLGTELRAFLADRGTATAGIPTVVAPAYFPADIIAPFSSRGPAAVGVKPDLAAPGVDVLAALAGDANAYGLMSGTSMATPHVAGAAALLGAVYPGWTVAELKSALMLTGVRAGVTSDGQAPAGPHERGAGRLDVAQAVQPALVMDETPLRMLLADPENGGDPATLNLPSLRGVNCVEACSWRRQFRNTTGVEVEYEPTFAGPASVIVTTQPPVLRISAGATATLDIHADVRAIAGVGEVVGDLLLVPTDSAHPTLAMPFQANAVVPLPEFHLAPEAIELTLPEGSSPVTVDVTLANTGLLDLQWSRELAGGGSGSALYSQLREDALFGAASGVYPAHDGKAVYFADTFVLGEESEIGGLFLDGFVDTWSAERTPADAYTAVSFYVFRDALGAPAGDPVFSPEAALWQREVSMGAPGLDVTAGDFQSGIEYVPADGERPVLPAGKYWLSAGTRNSGELDSGEEWYWFGTGSNAARDAGALVTDPDDLLGIGGGWSDAGASWLGSDFLGLSFEVRSFVSCDAQWTHLAASSGMLLAGEEEILDLRIDPAGLAPGRYAALLCLSSNDPSRPMAKVPVTLNVTQASSQPSGEILLSANVVNAGDALEVVVEVAPGTGPASTGLRVEMDLSGIGGSTTQKLYDDGSNGDAVAGDLAFSIVLRVADAAAPGDKVLRASIRDNEGRLKRESTRIHILGAVGDELFDDGFE